MRILFITDAIPYPPRSGNRIRTYNLLRRIAAQHQVWLATLLEGPDEAAGIPHLQEFCCGVEAASRQRRQPLAHLPGLLRFALAGRPLELWFEHSEDLAHKIRQLVSAVDFDIVHIEPSHMALYLEALPADRNWQRILVFHNIASDQYARLSRVGRGPAEKTRAWLHSRMMRQWEPRYAERFDRCITVSEADRQLLLAANACLPISVIPNGVDTRVYQPLPLGSGSPSLLYLGKMSYWANVDAALFLCHEILPRIRQVVPDTQLWIVGTDPTPEVRQLAGDRVHVTGSVDSVIPYYAQSTVCVVPLRAGGGTRLKILESMALGRPVVATTVGCEGLDVVDGQHLLVADSADQFAEKTARLLTDRQLYERVVTSARQLVVDRYDWDRIGSEMMQVYAQLTAGIDRQAVSSISTCPEA
jgi:sugar transferase (PEP-CTERM/EpsH1 system associated)